MCVRVCARVCVRENVHLREAKCLHIPPTRAWDPHLSETDVCRDPVSNGERHDVPGNQVSRQQMLELSFSYAAFETVKSQSVDVSIPVLCILINVSKDGRNTFPFGYGQTLVVLVFKLLCPRRCLGGRAASGRAWSLSEVRSFPCLSAWTRGWATRLHPAALGQRR